MQSAASAKVRARVIVSAPLGPLDYAIPKELESELSVGTPVKVPLGNRKLTGYVLEQFEDLGEVDYELKPIEAIDPDKSALPPHLLEVVRFAADYYGVPTGEMLDAALPAAARPSAYRYRLTPTAQSPLTGKMTAKDLEALEFIKTLKGDFTVAAIERGLSWSRRSALSRLKRLIDKKIIERVIKKQAQARKVAAYRRLDADADSLLTPRQKGARALLEKIPTSSPVTASELSKADSNAYSRLKVLVDVGLIEKIEIEQRLNPHEGDIPQEGPPPEPTADQQAVLKELLDALKDETFKPFLLHGVTGSGKTEVYLRLIERALEMGKTALVLVPEIALTPQLGSRFRARFGERVATFHSGLTTAERRDEWERIRSGEAAIGLGARSALFVPLVNVGVIIVDEEHETSFKQEENPRYHARDLAVYRGRLENAIVVLGSATPSLESRANADKGRYGPLSMPNRVNAKPLPEVETINLQEEERIGDGIFTNKMVEAIEKTVSQDEQVILFQNRRGFAPYVSCRDCGHTFRCDDCDISLTLHRKRGLLQCHYCGFETPAPDDCPSCGSFRVDSFGAGTERIESELNRLLPSVPVIRLDRDTVRKRSDLTRSLDTFRSGDARVLIGTQMVTKGHDFPGVTLVGVISGDASLNFPDFRAGERTFQLLTQVAGRAGRAEKEGRVLIQTFETSHYAITCAIEHSFEKFLAQEFAIREELFYPPFAHLALLRFESESEKMATESAQETAEKLREKVRADGIGVLILGPALAPLARLKGIFRVQVLVKAESRTALRQALQGLRRESQTGVRQILDVDPVSML